MDSRFIFILETESSGHTSSTHELHMGPEGVRGVSNESQVSGLYNWEERCYLLKSERFKKKLIWGRKMNNSSLWRC